MGNAGGYMPSGGMHSPSAHGGGSQKVGESILQFTRNLYFALGARGKDLRDVKHPKTALGVS